MGGIHHTEQTRARVIEEFLKCGRIDLAFERCDVARGCHYEWLKRFPDYAAAFKEARDQTADLLEDEAFRRAQEGVLEPVFQQGVQVGEIRKYSDSLMTWLLRGLRPERYNNEKFTLAGDKDNPLVVQQLTAAETIRRKRQERLNAKQE